MAVEMFLQTSTVAGLGSGRCLALVEEYQAATVTLMLDFHSWTDRVQVAPLQLSSQVFSVSRLKSSWTNLICLKLHLIKKPLVYCDEMYIKHKQVSLTGGKCFRANINKSSSSTYCDCAQNKKSTSQHTHTQSNRKYHEFDMHALYTQTTTLHYRDIENKSNFISSLNVEKLCNE